MESESFSRGFINFSPRQSVRILTFLLYSLTALLPLAAQAEGEEVSCPLVKIEAERLTDLNVPRAGHSLLLVNGEPTVIGGHTTNFVPTPTIEYFKDGKWTLLSSAFTHDDGFAVQLSSGHVLIGGGHERNLGIGQSYEVELYDPLSRTCEGFGSLDTKRAMASAIALDGNRAVITGNWYHDDAIEMYDGKGGFIPVKTTRCNRANPYILRTAKDDAIIFTGLDANGMATPHPVIDCLHGEAFHEPLLEEWSIPKGYEKIPACAFIGDESKGNYCYLLLVENEQQQAAIARVTNGDFSLLPTDVPVPMTCKWGDILYSSHIYADRQSRRAYVLGSEPDKFCQPPKLDLARIYVLIIDYASVPAHLTLGYTDKINDFDIIGSSLVTDNGELMMIGGTMHNNFKPLATTWLLHVSPHAQAAGIGRWFSLLPLWGWLLVILALAALATLLIMLRRRRSSLAGEKTAMIPEESEEFMEHEKQEQEQEAADAGIDYSDLMHRICQLMEEHKLYLNPNLKITDLAIALGSNRSTISACINSQRDCSFPQFVNTYRMALAQELLMSQPDIKIAEVWMNAGFSSEASFYRIFKAATGTTPIAWKANKF